MVQRLPFLRAAGQTSGDDVWGEVRAEPRGRGEVDQRDGQLDPSYPPGAGAGVCVLCCVVLFLRQSLDQVASVVSLTQDVSGNRASVRFVVCLDSSSRDLVEVRNSRQWVSHRVGCIACLLFFADLTAQQKPPTCCVVYICCPVFSSLCAPR